MGYRCYSWNRKVLLWWIKETDQPGRRIWTKKNYTIENEGVCIEKKMETGSDREEKGRYEKA